MEESEMSGSWPRKKKLQVAACSDGQSCDTKAKVRKGKGFSTKSRYSLPSRDPGDNQEIKQPTSGTNMNVRDLGGNPGQPTYNAGSDRDVEERKKAEIQLTKKRKFFGK